MTLHIVTTSPFKSSALSDCLDVFGEDDALLLIGDGAYAVQAKPDALTNVTSYVLSPDCEARGLAAQSLATPIDYDEMVLLTVQYNPIKTWY